MSNEPKTAAAHNAGLTGATYQFPRSDSIFSHQAFSILADVATLRSIAQRLRERGYGRSPNEIEEIAERLESSNARSKSNAAARPTALGTLINSSTYGQAIRTIIGTTRVPPQLIWANNLREGGSSKKSKKKGVTTYVENVDFMLGSNPIPGVLQFWTNNNYKYPLDFVKLDVTLLETQTYTITDPDFYFLVAVTMDVRNFGTFNDYGAQGSSAYDVTIRNAAMERSDWRA